MTLSKARAVADAVLFEGYLLYPYRASALKNRMRWQFGVLAPRGAGAAENWFAQTECMLEATPSTTVDIRMRCLQLRHRGGEKPWDEGIVREFAVPVPLAALEQPRTVMFELPAGTDRRDGANWHRYRVPGLIHIESRRVDHSRDVRRIQVRVENRSEWTPSAADVREDVLRRSLASVHTMLAVRDGSFLSLLDPPEWAQDIAAACRNTNTWPVLVGDPQDRDVVLSSPIILYDHPAIAPQSPGDLFDATEIDEILTLRTMTLTDEEKREVRQTDPRAAELLDRVEQLPAEALERLHGTLRFPRNEH